MIKTRTSCCALAQIADINNDTSLADIVFELKELRRQKRRNTEVGITTGNGQTSVFVIASPGEDRLKANLTILGFKSVRQFERRRGYPKTGDLHMYIKNL